LLTDESSLACCPKGANQPINGLGHFPNPTHVDSEKSVMIRMILFSSFIQLAPARRSLSLMPASVIWSINNGIDVQLLAKILFDQSLFPGRYPFSLPTALNPLFTPTYATHIFSAIPQPAY
jgi:hypothetical protein